MEKEFNYSQAPYQYPLCINRECSKADTCLRQLVERNIPNHTVHYTILNPGHLATIKGDCPHYRSNEKVLYAKGFIGILNQLPYKQMLRIVGKLTALFDRRTYYRVRKGERLLSPNEQQAIRDLLRECGVDHNIEFDSYSKEYDW